MIQLTDTISAEDNDLTNNNSTAIPTVHFVDDEQSNINSTYYSFINETFKFGILFNNTGSATGFQPAIQLILPNELTNLKVTYEGLSVTTKKVGTFTAENNYTLTDPYTQLPVHGYENYTLYLLRLPHGSYATKEPASLLELSCLLNTTDITKALNIMATPEFIYGKDPLDKPDSDPPLIGKTVTTKLIPTVLKVTKDSNLHEDETATGPNFPFTYSVIVDIARGATVENITIIDNIPQELVLLNDSTHPIKLTYANGTLIDSDSYSITVINTTSTGGQILIKIDNFTGKTLHAFELTYTVYAAEYYNVTESNTTQTYEVLDSATGKPKTLYNTVLVDYNYNNNTYSTDDSDVVILKSLAIQGHADTYVITNNTNLTRTIDFQISDYFSMDNLTFYHSSGHSLGSAQIFSFKPIKLTFEGKTYYLNDTYYGYTRNSDGTLDIWVYLSKFLSENNITNNLTGGYYNGSTGGSALKGSIFIEFILNDHHNITNGSTVTADDHLHSYMEATAKILPSNNNITDDSSVHAVIDNPVTTKIVYAIDGNTSSIDMHISSNQNVTFLITTELPVGTLNNFTITDFFPMPVFTVKDMVLENSTTGVIPSANHWAFFIDDFLTYENGSIINPTVSFDVSQNSLTFYWPGEIYTPEYETKTVSILITLQDTNVPMADELGLINLVEVIYENSTNHAMSHVSVIPSKLITNEPDLIINKTASVQFIENNTEVTYSILVKNIGHAYAYDIIVKDDFMALYGDLIQNGAIVSINASYGNGTVIDIDKDSLFNGTGFYIYSLTNRTDSGLADNFTITYTLIFNEKAIPGENITNVANITHFSSGAGTTNFINKYGNQRKYSANATVQAKFLDFSKTFAGSNDNYTNKGLTIGENGTFNLTIILPDLIVENITIEDTLPEGLKYIGYEIVASEGIKYNLSKVTVDGRKITFDFATITPANNHDNILTVRLFFTPEDDLAIFPINTVESQKTNKATLKAYNVTFEDSATVNIYQPKVDITKEFTGDAFQGNDEVNFTISVKNNGKDTAYNITIVDNLTELIDNFVIDGNYQNIKVYIGDKLILYDNSSLSVNNGVYTIYLGNLSSGQSFTIKFVFIIKDSVLVNINYKNTATLSYYSTPTNNTNETRHYTSEAHDEFHIIDPKVSKSVVNSTIDGVDYNGQLQVVPGENVTYLISINLTKGYYDNLTIKDTLPQGFHYVNDSIIILKGNTQVDKNIYNIKIDGSNIIVEFIKDTNKFTSDILENYSGIFKIYLTAFADNSSSRGDVKTNTVTFTWNKMNSATSKCDVTICEPTLTIDKKFNVTNVEGGDSLSFTITISNNGNDKNSNSTIFNITAIDNLTNFYNNVAKKENLQFTVLKGDNVSVKIVDDVVYITAPILKYKDIIVVQFNFTVKDDIVIGITYTNHANATGYSARIDDNGTKAYFVDNSDTISTKSAAVSKTVVNSTILNGKTNITIGENVTYLITATLAKGEYHTLIVTDTLPTGLKYINGSVLIKKGNTEVIIDPADYTVTIDNDKIIITFKNATKTSLDLINNYSSIFNVYLNATLLNVTDNTAGSTKTNKVTLTWNDKSSNSQVDVKVVEPKITITKAFSDHNVEGRDNVTFTITIKNTGDSPLFNTTLTDNLTELINRFVVSADNISINAPAGANVTINNGLYTINLGQLAVGETITVIFNFTIKDNVVINLTDYKNTATAYGYSVPNIENARIYINSATDSFSLNKPSINKTVYNSTIDNGVANVTIGESVIYKINVTLPVGFYNNITITDTLPEGFVLNSVYIGSTEITHTNNSFTYTLTSINSNTYSGCIVIYLNATLLNHTSNKVGVKKTNTANIYLDTILVASSSAETLVVEPDIEISKKVLNHNGEKYSIDENITYNITVKNIGTSPAFNITITDYIPDYLTYNTYKISNKSWAVSYNNKQLTITGDFLDVNAEFWFTITCGLNHTSIDDIPTVLGRNITNTVNITYTSNNGTIYRLYNNSARSTIHVIATDLSINKTATSSQYMDNITYTITILNKGPDTATSVKIIDYLPEGVIFISADNNGKLENGVITWEINSLGRNQEITLKVVVKINKTGNITNNVTITGSESETNYKNNNDSVTVDIPPAVDLAIKKTANQTSANYTGSITYTITVTNNGPSTATNVEVKDILPEGIVLINSNASKGNYVNSVWNVGNLSVGEIATLNITAYVNKTGDITNKANISSKEYDWNKTNNEDNITVNIPSATDLAIIKTVNQNIANYTGNVTYTITVTNNGPSSATGVTVVDVLPERFTYISSELSKGSYDVSTGVWNVGDLVVGETCTLSIKVHIDRTGNVTNKANVTGNEYDWNKTNNYAEIPIEIPLLIDLDINKTANQTSANYTGSITYTISVTNHGIDNATGVIVTDLLPAGITLTSYSASKGTYVDGVWTVGNLGVGEVATLNIIAYVNTTGSVINSANVSGNEFDWNLTNNEDNVTVTVPSSADLAISKTANQSSVNYTGSITYTISVINYGVDNATGVIVTDLLPEGFEYIDSTLSKGSYNASTGVWTVGNLSVGEIATLNITVYVNITEDIINIAIVSGNEFDWDLTNNEDNVTVTVPPSADLAISKIVNQSVVNFTGSVTYTISVINYGVDNATGVTVTDLLPEGFVYTGSVSSKGDYIDGIWTVGNLSVGEVATLNITVYVNATGIITNVAIVSGNEFDWDLTNNEDNVTVSVPHSSDLTIEKTVNQTVVNYTGSITYTITVINNGPNNSTDVIVTDLLPSGVILTYFSTSKGDYVDGVWTVGNLGVGEVATLDISVYVNATGDIINIANVTANEYDWNKTNNEDNITINVPPATDLNIEKTVNQSVVNYTGSITYTISVINYGVDNATGVVVTDILPDGITLIGSIASKGSYTDGIWTIGNLNVGETAILNIIVYMNITGDIINVASVFGNEFDWDLTNNEDNITVNIPPSVDLAINKTVNQSDVNFTGSITYTISVINYGVDNATGVTVTDLLPEGLAYIGSVSSKGDYIDGIWTIGNLNVGEIAILNITVYVNTTGNITNKANIQGNEYDWNKTNNEDNVTVNVLPDPDLAISKTVNQSSVNYTGSITYTITVINNGPDSATGVTVTDVLPDGLVYIGSVSSKGDYIDGIWTIGNLTVGEVATLNITVYVNTTGNITNVATVSGNEFDWDLTNNEDNVTVSVPPSADLTIEKTVNQTVVNYTGSITYTITVNNHGVDNATGVTVVDVLPEGFTYIDSISSKGIYNASTGVWTIGNLTVGEAATLNITVYVNTTGNITNKANIQGNEFDWNKTNEDNITVNVPLSSDLVISKTIKESFNKTIVYIIDVTNNGPDSATSIKITDILPDGAIFISSSTGNYNKTTGIIALDKLGVNETISIVLTVNITTACEILNMANVSSSEYDWNLTNNEDNVTYIPTADLEVTKTANNSVFIVGDRVTYTITVRNNGFNTAFGTYAIDNLPSTLKFVSYNVNMGYYDYTAGLWIIGDLNTGDLAILNIVCIIEKEGTINNSVFVDSNTTEYGNATNQANVTITVNPKPLVENNDSSKIVQNTMKNTGNPIFALLLILLTCVGLKLKRVRK